MPKKKEDNSSNLGVLALKELTKLKEKRSSTNRFSVLSVSE